MTMMAEGCLWEGRVRHRRYAPRPHAFRYSLFMVGLDGDRPGFADYMPLIGEQSHGGDDGND